jgi:hypothetical protein
MTDKTIRMMRLVGVFSGTVILCLLALSFCHDVPVIDCPRCKGVGKFEGPAGTDHGDNYWFVIPCDHCKGARKFSLWDAWACRMVWNP